MSENCIVLGEDLERARAAAEDVVTNGRRGEHTAMVLGLVTCYPGRTAGELWARTPGPWRAELKELQELRRGLTVLKVAGYVARGEQRLCEERDTWQCTWTETKKRQG